jgi:NTE family protein
VSDHLDRTQRIFDASHDITDLRRRMGAAAIARAATSDELWEARWRPTVAARFPNRVWPDRSLLITAVDAETGEPVVFDRDSGVELVDAVAASCSSGLPYRIGQRRYIDGGYRSNAENADLAAGCARVLVLSPFGGRSLAPQEWGTHLSIQVEGLRAQGSRVETIFPDSASEHLFGVNGMDPSLRPAAARAGHQLGRVRAESLAEFWRGGMTTAR